MDVIWLIVRIIYIIYKGFQEKPDLTKDIFKIIGIMGLVVFLPWLIFYGIAGPGFAKIIFVVYMVVFGIVAFFIYHFKRVASIEKFESMMNEEENEESIFDEEDCE